MTDLYYTVQWQMIEERVNGAVTTQNVFSPVYIDAMILGDRDASAAGNKPGLDQRHYAHYDANFNVTSISRNTTPAPTTAVPNPTPSWGVVERYLYDPYGQAFVLSNTWSSQNASTNAWQYLHQGLRWEGSVGLYDNRNRFLSSSLGRFNKEDPLGFVDGLNLYQYVKGNPVGYLDPSGFGTVSFPQVSAEGGAGGVARGTLSPLVFGWDPNTKVFSIGSSASLSFGAGNYAGAGASVGGSYNWQAHSASGMTGASIVNSFNAGPLGFGLGGDSVDVSGGLVADVGWWSGMELTAGKTWFSYDFKPGIMKAAYEKHKVDEAYRLQGRMNQMGGFPMNRRQW